MSIIKKNKGSGQIEPLMKFSNAIVRKPGKSMVAGLSGADLGKPDYHEACAQHASYVEALRDCGLQVKILEADEDFPDSTFIEDTALLTPRCAVITNPGAPSRRGEVVGVKPAIEEYYSDIEEIRPPGTVEAGDIMMAGRHFFIGLSGRTNPEGARQVIRILSRYGMSGSVVPLEKVLHLKTGVSYLEHDNLAACGEFLSHPAFKRFHIIEIPAEESYAANCVWINDRVLVAKGFPQTRRKIRDAGYAVIEVDVSEFRKLDGGLSCLSLRF